MSVRRDYRTLARAVEAAIGDIDTFIDIGSGSGMLLDSLHEVYPWASGIGVEWKANVEFEQVSEFALEKTVWCSKIDGNSVDPRVWPAELACCIEVAEHVSPEKADVFVADVASASSKWILWSAAHPGQGGEGHVNERPRLYWASKFLKHGFDSDTCAHGKMIAGLSDLGPRRYLLDNLLLLRRG